MIILAVTGIFGVFDRYFATDWLMDLIDDYHIEVGLLPTILSALLIFGVGISTASLTILKAAKANPVETLRDDRNIPWNQT